VGRVDLENLISYNQSERCRLVSKIPQYNAMVNNTLFVFPMKATRVVRMPVLGSERVNDYTPAKRLDNDWLYMSTWEEDEMDMYGDELDELHEFIDCQFAGVICRPPSYDDPPPQVPTVQPTSPGPTPDSTGPARPSDVPTPQGNHPAQS